MTKTRALNHGRETYAVYYGDGFVLKRPLPSFSDEQKEKWLEKQHNTKEIIDSIRAINHTVYNIPNMVFINDDEYQILEERALGVPLTSDVYRKLSKRQRTEIENGLATFLVDMNELKEPIFVKNHKITDEFKFQVLQNFVENRMSRWFTRNEVLQMKRFCKRIDGFSHDTYKAWSHGDLNSGNVLYNESTSVLSFIDFAEADYHFVFSDIFSPLQNDLGIGKRVYEKYIAYHKRSLFPMPGLRSEELQQIIKYRAECTLLKRFLKASQDLRPNSTAEKAIRNNIEKVGFMRDQLAMLVALDKKYSKVQ